VHLCLASIVCRSYEKKTDFAGPPRESPRTGYDKTTLKYMYCRNGAYTKKHSEYLVLKYKCLYVGTLYKYSDYCTLA
jgi:hypothetical protein